MTPQEIEENTTIETIVCLNIPQFCFSKKNALENLCYIFSLHPPTRIKPSKKKNLITLFFKAGCPHFWSWKGKRRQMEKLEVENYALHICIIKIAIIMGR